MTKQQSAMEAEELSQLARLLFDAAASKWYTAAVIDVLNGASAALLSVFDLAGGAALMPAIVEVMLLIVSAALRMWAESQYDTADTMRRQSVLSEALGWPISTVQLSEWRRKAGHVERRLAVSPRPADYYETRRHVGPQRLAEMTTESAFYTRHLYARLQAWCWGLGLGALAAFFLAVSVVLTHLLPNDILIARVLYASVPIVVTFNLFGWARKLGRLKGAITEVEADLERLQDTGVTDQAQVLRLVSEYNCQVVAGLPIHKKLFDHWHDSIRDYWTKRR